MRRMKPKTMTRIIQSIQRAIFACIALSIAPSTLAFATPVTNRREDVGIKVDSKIDDSGKTLITCELSNFSRHPIATVNLQTHSSVFYFKLMDQTGKEIAQEPEWAKEFAQKSSKRYSRPKSIRGDTVYPGKSLKFEFHLEDAYGAESSKGREMVVSWESNFPDEMLTTSDRIDAEGKPVKGSVEKYMFPQYWNISVTLPLNKKALGLYATTEGELNTLWTQNKHDDIEVLLTAKMALTPPDVVAVYCAKFFYMFIKPDKAKALAAATKLKQIATATQNVGFIELADHEIAEVQQIPDAEFTSPDAEEINQIHTLFPNAFPNAKTGGNLKKVYLTP